MIDHQSWKFAISSCGQQQKLGIVLDSGIHCTTFHPKWKQMTVVYSVHTLFQLSELKLKVCFQTVILASVVNRLASKQGDAW